MRLKRHRIRRRWRRIPRLRRCRRRRLPRQLPVPAISSSRRHRRRCNPAAERCTRRRRWCSRHTQDEFPSPVVVSCNRRWRRRQRHDRPARRRSISVDRSRSHRLSRRSPIAAGTQSPRTVWSHCRAVGKLPSEEGTVLCRKVPSEPLHRRPFPTSAVGRPSTLSSVHRVSTRRAQRRPPN